MASAGLRIAIAGGYFAALRRAERDSPRVDIVARGLVRDPALSSPDAHAARVGGLSHHAWRKARRFISTGSATRAHDFDPDARDRLIAGSMLPARLGHRGAKIPPVLSRRGASLVRRGRRHARAGDPVPRAQARQKTLVLDGVELPVRPNLGIFTQPISFIGLPVVAVPVWPAGGTLPIGVQVIAPRGARISRSASRARSSGTMS